MHRLTTNFIYVLLFGCVIFFMLGITIVIMKPMEFETSIGGAACCFVALYLCRRVQWVSYDSDWVYVQGVYKNETISMDEIESIIVPESFFRKRFGIELKSGMIIYFAPYTFNTMSNWKEIPVKVRRFQAAFRNFQLNQPS